MKKKTQINLLTIRIIMAFIKALIKALRIQLIKTYNFLSFKNERYCSYFGFQMYF